MPKNKHIVVKASSIQKQRIKKFADDNEMDISEFVRYACEFFISRGSLFYPDSELAIQSSVNINPVMDLLKQIQRDLKTEIKAVKRSVKLSDLQLEEMNETKNREIAIRKLRRLLQTEKFKEQYLQDWISLEVLEEAIRNEDKAIAQYFDWEQENIPLEEYPDKNILADVLFDLNGNHRIDWNFNKGIKALM
jgi:hypothetical protein